MEHHSEHPIVHAIVEAAALEGLGLRIAMITGDNQRTAEAIARKLGIDEVRRLQDRGHPPLAMAVGQWLDEM